MSFQPISQRLILIALTFAMPSISLADTSLSLKDSISYAVSHNRMLSATASQVNAAEAQVSAATGQLLPRLDVSTGFYRTNSPLNNFGTLLLQKRVATADFAPAKLNNPGFINNYQSRLGLTLPLYNGGVAYAARSKASANAEAAALNFEFQKQQLIYQTIVTYVQSRQALAQVKAQKKAVRAAEQRLKDAKALKKRGMAIKSDVMDANVYVLRNQLALDDAKNQYQNSLDALRLVMGISHAQTLGTLQEPNIQNVSTSLDALLTSAVQNRADLLALEQQGLAAESSSKQAKAGYMPHVNLTAAREWNSETFGLNNENDSIGLTVSMNLFAGGSDSANVRAAESARITLELQQADKQQQIQNEVRQAWRSLQTAKKKLRSESEAFKQTTESLRIKALRHKQGLENTSDLLASQVQADQTHVMFIHATYDLIIAKAALLLAAGTLNEEVVQ